jgi:hypothetical protein
LWMSHLGARFPLNKAVRVTHSKMMGE